MLFFPVGTLLSLGKLIKEALLSVPCFFHLLKVGPHSSWLLLTSVHQRAPKKKEPPRQDSLATHNVLWSPVRVQFAKLNKDYLGRFRRITVVRMSDLRGVGSKHIMVRHHFGVESANRQKAYFSLRSRHLSWE